MRLLARGDVLSSLRDFDDGDTVVVTLNGYARTYPEELLSSRNDMSHHEGGSQRIDDVLIVGVEDEAAVNFACGVRTALTLEADDCLQLEVLFHDFFKMFYLNFIKFKL